MHSEWFRCEALFHPAQHSAQAWYIFSTLWVILSLAVKDVSTWPSLPVKHPQISGLLHGLAAATCDPGTFYGQVWCLSSWHMSLWLIGVDPATESSRPVISGASFMDTNSIGRDYSLHSSYWGKKCGTNKWQERHISWETILVHSCLDIRLHC